MTQATSTLFTPQDSNILRLRSGSLVAGVPVTVRESESHAYTSTPTELALESGAVVTDHVIVKPETCTVSFAVTNAGEGRSQAKDAFAALVDMVQSRRLVELVTEHAVYNNMICTSVSPIHQAPYKGALTCSATFQKVYFVELISAGRAPSQLRGTSKKTAAGQTQAGKVEAQPVQKTAARKVLGNFWE